MITVDVDVTNVEVDEETGARTFKSMDEAVANNANSNLSKDQNNSGVEDGFCFQLIDTRVKVTPMMDDQTGAQRKIESGRNKGKDMMQAQYIVKPIGKQYKDTDRVLLSTRIFEQIAFKYDFSNLNANGEARRGAMVRGNGDVNKLYNRTLNKTKAIESIIAKQKEKPTAIKVTYTEVESCAFQDAKTPETARVANLNFIPLEEAENSEV